MAKRKRPRPAGAAKRKRPKRNPAALVPVLGPFGPVGNSLDASLSAFNQFIRGIGMTVDLVFQVLAQPVEPVEIGYYMPPNPWYESEVQMGTPPPPQSSMPPSPPLYQQPPEPVELVRGPDGVYREKEKKGKP